MRQVMEASLNEYVDQLEKSLPIETENGLNINFITEDSIFKRRFNPNDKIIV